MACETPTWFRSCGGAQGTACVGSGGSGEGCQETAGSCEDCYRGIILGLLPGPGPEPKRKKYFVGHFMDGLFILDSARGLAKYGLRRGDALLEVNNKRVTRSLMRRFQQVVKDEARIKAQVHRNHQPSRVIEFVARRKPTKE